MLNSSSSSKKNARFSRRDFVKSSILATGAYSFPSIILGQQSNSPNNKLNIACIGIGGKGIGDVGDAAKHGNIVALCDIDPEVRGAETISKHPNATVFTDYRKMFDKMGKDIDAVTISVPDHSHFPAAMLAMSHGKHVMVQKPLANTIWETRELQKKAKETGVTTQMGIQGHTYEGMRLLKEWYQAGILGDITKVRYWTNRPIWPQSGDLRITTKKPPLNINWDVWCGTVARKQSYSPELHPFKWRAFWDYGCGALGDIGCHLFDHVFWTLDLDYPESVEVESMDPISELTGPSKSVLRYKFTSKNGKPPVEFHWSDGGIKPDRPEEFTEKQNIDKQFGQLIYGTKNTIYSPGGYCKTLRLIPEKKMKELAKNRPKRIFPRVKGGPIGEWATAIKQGKQPGANFDYSAKLTEVVLLGVLAIRLNKKIEWDAKNMKAKGLPEADALIKREYRKGWENFA